MADIQTSLCVTVHFTLFQCNIFMSSCYLYTIFSLKKIECHGNIVLHIASVAILPDTAEPPATNIATAIKNSAQRTVSRL